MLCGVRVCSAPADHVIQVSRLVTCGRSGSESFQVITLHCCVYADERVRVCVLLGSLVTVIWCSVMPTQNITDPISLSSL